MMNGLGESRKGDLNGVWGLPTRPDLQWDDAIEDMS